MGYDGQQIILTPCPPKKHCRICEARLSAVFGSADRTNKYLHQSAEAGRKAVAAIRAGNIGRAVDAAVRAASFANLVLNTRYAAKVA